MRTARQTVGHPGALPRAWSLTAARDRISSTLFLAALLHGIVILGVTFGAADLAFEPATSLDVVLVIDTDREQPAPRDAEVLAQQSLDGAGNTVDALALQTASPRSPENLAPGPNQAGSHQPEQQGASEQAPLVVSSSATVPTPRTAELGRPREQSVPQRTALPGVASMVELIDEAATETVISDPDPRELVISARTRESRIAAYLSNWKRKVERIGTLNFPRQATAQRLRKYPTLEVAISADGQLQDVIVRNSSGERALDDAAVEILRIAAPFDPFPEFLRADYDVLRFAYEWRFGAESRVQQLSARSTL